MLLALHIPDGFLPPGLSLVGWLLALGPLAWALRALFPVLAVWRLVAAVRETSAENLAKAMLAIMAAILFSVSAHVWPWYVMWILIPAALVPTWWLARFAIGVAFMAPFMSGSWWIAPFEDHFGGTAFALYLGALVWAVENAPEGGRVLEVPAIRALGDAR